MKLKYFAPLLAFALSASGCGPGAAPAQEPEHDHAEHAANGDLQETTASVETLPSFLDSQPDIVRNAYLVAGLSAELLQWIPCYCGCGESAGHGSSLNCFVREVNEDGSVVWDDHGTRCGVCIEIAVQAVVLSKEGRSVSEIRQAIDDAYKEGYAAPTPTPAPPSAQL